jgi:hypothetical protein
VSGPRVHEDLLEALFATPMAAVSPSFVVGADTELLPIPQPATAQLGIDARASIAHDGG